MTIRSKADQQKYSNLISNGRMVLLLSFSFFSTFLLWAISWWIIGKNEPWDSSYPFYSLTMPLIGLLLGLFTPHRRCYVYLLIAVWLGQLFALLTIPWLAEAGWFFFGLIATALGSLWILPGLFAGYYLRASKKT